MHEDAATWRVTTDDGGTVTTTPTPTHRFWVQGTGWTKAQDLTPGDRLRATAPGTTRAGAPRPTPPAAPETIRAPASPTAPP